MDRSHSRLALGHAAVASHVTVLAADDQVDRIDLADVADSAQRRGVDPREATLAQAPDASVTELDLDRPAMNEVQLLLVVVIVNPGLDPGWNHDRVDPERGHAEALADLAKARALAERVEVRRTA